MQFFSAPIFPNVTAVSFQAEHVLKEGDFSILQDPDLVNFCNQDQFERMALAATLCIRHMPQSRPDIATVSIFHYLSSTSCNLISMAR